MTTPTVPFEEYVGWQDTWIKRVIEFDSDNLLPIPTDDSVILSNNGISHVVLHRPTATIYKRSIPYLIENEIYCLSAMNVFAEDKAHPSFVPKEVKRFDKYTISMEYLGESQPVRNKIQFKKLAGLISSILPLIRIRHGDITPPNVIVRDDIPHILDWAESRFVNDPRPDKRPNGDKYYLEKTFTELCK